MGAAGEAGGRLLVIVVSVRPQPRSDVALAASFAAVADALGPRSIDDVVLGPAGTVIVVAETTSPRAMIALASIRAGVRRALEQRGEHSDHVEVATLGTLQGKARYVRETIEHWVDHLERETTVTAERRSYLAAVTQLLEGEGVRTLFQPIVDVAGPRILGYEALSRGPLGHHLEPAPRLLHAAEVAGLEREMHIHLVRLARERALQRLSGSDLLLFVNTGPTSLWAARGSDGLGLRQRMVGAQWPSQKLVLEVTERTPIHDTAEFLLSSGRSRALGLRFALDDAGAGYAGLATLAVVAPEFIKIDMSLIRGCDTDRLKRGIIASLVHLAQLSGSEVIAEGVETLAELDVVANLGVRMIQGYVFARPVETPSAVQPEPVGVDAAEEMEVIAPSTRPAEDDAEADAKRESPISFTRSPWS